MKKQEYLQALESELEAFSEEERRDILLEIEDHIDELQRMHPDSGEEVVVAGLESPADLASALRAESGRSAEAARPAESARPADEKPGAETEPEPEASREDREGRAGRRGKARITIDGRDLEDIIRRALDVAGIFKNGAFKAGFKVEDSDDEDEGDRKIVMNDLPVDGLEKIFVTASSADISVKLSASGFFLSAKGPSHSKLTVRRDTPDTMVVSVPRGGEEPEMIEIGVPSSVDLVSLATASGDVEVADRVGDLDIRTASGDVVVRSCSGNVRANTASGDIAVSNCSERLELKSASGDIRAELDAACDSVRIGSVSGDIELLYPEDMDTTVRWSSLSGDIDCDAQEKGPTSCIIGAGLVPISISTTSGDIRIARSRKA
ncbi:MAG TPA: DUF4097 family beta strand repeat-containing protein [Rectinemataceae bacterium]